MSKAEQTRQFIIEKTAPIFNHKGYAGTSLTDMTTATGLTKGSIYGNFENKDEVAIAAFNYNVKNLLDIFQSEIDKQTTFKGKLMVYPTIYSSFPRRLFNTGGCPILNTATEADDTHPILKSNVEKVITFWKERLIGFIEKGMDNGEFKAGNINPERTALTIIATIEGAIMITKITNKLSNLTDIMTSVTKLIDDLE